MTDKEAVSAAAIGIIARDEVQHRAEELDHRRRAQIANQIKAINRILKDGSYDAEMKKLQEAAATMTAQLETLQEELAAANRINLDLSRRIAEHGAKQDNPRSKKW